MQWKRFADIALIQANNGRVFGLHPYNLDVAELPAAAWLQTTQANETITQDLLTWNNEINDKTQDALPDLKRPVLSLNIAQVCNLHCTYCAAGGDGTYGSKTKSMDLSVGEKILREFFAPIQEGNVQLHFLGGEPLLYPEIMRSFCQYALLLCAGKPVNLQFSVTTNGTLFRQKVLDTLKQFHFSVTISIDGAPEVQNKNRPAKGTVTSAQMIETGLAQLALIRKDLGQVTVNSVFGTHNLDVLETYKYLRTLPIIFDEYNFNFSNSDKQTESTTQYIRAMETLATYIITTTDGLDEILKITQFGRVLAKIFAQTRHHNYCGANHTLKQVDTRGDVYGCNWFIGDKNEQVELSGSTDTTSMIETNNCESCWVRHLCAGGCMAVHKAFSGQKQGKDPLFCKRSRDLAAIAISAYGETLCENEMN